MAERDRSRNTESDKPAVDDELKVLIESQRADDRSSVWGTTKRSLDAPTRASAGESRVDRVASPASEERTDEPTQPLDMEAVLTELLEAGEVERADRLVVAREITPTQFQAAVRESHHGWKLRVMLGAARAVFIEHGRRATQDTASAQVATLLESILDAYGHGDARRLTEMVKHLPPKRSQPPLELTPGQATRVMAELLTEGDGLLLFQGRETLPDLLVPEIRAFFPDLPATIDAKRTRGVVVDVLDRFAKLYARESAETVAAWRDTWERELPSYHRPLKRADGAEPPVQDWERERIAYSCLRAMFVALGAAGERADRAMETLRKDSERKRDREL